ncbi:MAG TPA: hypothetical protein VMV76_01610 [Dehalococcoidia bacterium]|nr:hypothetical protein [Dehalococcoidia bacterium]
MLINRVNLYGAITANVINISTILIFVARLLEKPEIGHWIGIIIQFTIIPLFYLLYAARSLNRARIYYIQVSLMIVFIIVEFLVDWYPKIEFRNNLLIVIPYVMLFFGATGGMIGVASLAGKRWTVVTVLSFLIMLVLAFIQRQITGM